MNLLRATPLLSLLSILPACGPGNVCIGDCSPVDEGTEAGDPTNGTTGEPTSAGDPSGSSTMADPPDTDPGVTTTETSGETDGEGCDVAFENDFDPLQGCSDGTQNPREFCFVDGMGTTVGIFDDLLSVIPVRITDGGVDVLVNQSDRSVSAMLDGAEPFFDTTHTDWQFQLANGTFTWTAAGDLDEDGIQDVVGRNITTVPGEESVHIFTLNPDGDLKTQDNLGIGEIRFGPAILDWNSDEHLDIVVVAVVVGDETPSVLALRGDGTGAFSPNQQLLAFDDQQLQFALGDLDGDGPDDLAATRADGGVDVAIDQPEFLRHDLGTTPQFHAIEISDLNDDGLGDVVVLFDDLDESSMSTVGVLLQQPSAGDPSFELSLHRVLCNATALAIGDLDGDGAVDIVTGGPANALVTIRRGDGQGGFAETVAFELGRPADRLFIADFDGNGARDILSLDLAGSFLGFAGNSP